MKNLTLPASITDIKESAFENCEALEKVYYDGTLNSWAQINFENSYSNPMCFAE